MSPFDPQKPLAPQTLTTNPSPPETVVVHALVRALEKEHGAFILATLLARRDVLPASAPDLRQRVLLILCKHIEQHKKAPDQVRGFLFGVIRNEVCNHKQRWTLDIAPGADVEEKASSSRGPEGRADFAERSAKLERHLASLPVEEAEVMRCIGLLGMTIAETAEAVRRSLTTVARQRDRARAKLEELVRASERATALGERRADGRVR